MAARVLPVLMYHHVSPHPGLVTVTPETFRAQMAWLSRHHWRVLTTAEIEAYFAGQPFPGKSVAITFDDGYADNWRHAHPVLAEFGFTAQLFVVTGWLGDGPVRGDTELPCPDHETSKKLVAAGDADRVMLRWSEVEAMATAGSFEFHSHTHTHTRWDLRHAPGPVRHEALAADLAQSRSALTERLGAVSRHLCWPQGFYDDDYIELARQAGFDHLYTTERRANRPGGDTFRIGRISTKERPGAAWLGRRLDTYRSPWLSRLYFAVNDFRQRRQQE
jgi:peptidoglycan/xylan/chitin deacetylase (PgdA/CDA1 family)